MRSPSVRYARSVLPAIALLATAAPAADAAQRYASPDGSAAAQCSFAQPCALETAVEGAVARDEVIVAPGTYAVTSAIDAPAAIDVHGIETEAKPVLVGAESLLESVLSFKAGGTLRHLDIEATAPDTDALTLSAGTAENLRLLSDSGDGAKVTGSAGVTVLRDSVVVTRSTDSSSAGLKLNGGGVSSSGDIALRNLTVYAPDAAGIRCSTTVGSASIVNVIARGATMDIDASRSRARCITASSVYRSGAAPGITPSASDRLGEPGFVDAPAGRLDVVAGSAPVDNGDPAATHLGTRDAAGRDRAVVGAPIDIGAYEWTAEGVAAWPKPKPPKPPVTPDPTPTPTPIATPTPSPQPSTGRGGATPPAHGLNGTQPGKDKDKDKDGEQPGAPPVPVIGKTVVIVPASGTVRFRAPGSTGYVALDGSAPVPSGSVVDTRKGAVDLSSALDASGRSQTGRFRGALFQVTQPPNGRGMTHLALRGGDFGACRKSKPKGATASAKRKKPRRRLWGSDKGGRFRTQGRDSVATARGTKWLTEDTCAGTRVKVTEGAVEVRPLRGGKTVLVKAGQQRLVRSRPR